MGKTKIEYRKFKMICPDCNGSGTSKGHKCTCKNGTRNVIIKVKIDNIFEDITNQEDWLTKVGNKEIGLNNENFN